MKFKFFIFAIILIFILLPIFSLAEPPTARNVQGFVFRAPGTGAENGIQVRILNTNLSNYTDTQVFAPPVPQLAGAYSATILASTGDYLEVYAWNGTTYGLTSVIVVGTTTLGNVTMNLTRPPEPDVDILTPANDSLHNITVSFIVQANVTVTVNNGTCNATIYFGNSSVLQTSESVVELGFMLQDTSALANFTIVGIEVGTSNVTVIANCSPHGPILNATPHDTIFNVTIIDQIPPNVTLLTPSDTTQAGIGRFNFSYRPYDTSLANCTFYAGIGVFSNLSANSTPANNVTNYFRNLFFKSGIVTWNVYCSDEYNNTGYAVANFTLDVIGPDINVNRSLMWFSDSTRVEGYPALVYVNITNEGLSPVNESFHVRFYFGDPLSGGVSLGSTTVSNISVSNQVTVNFTHTLILGINELFVVADTNATINESYEGDERKSNNNASINGTVPLYHVYYGNINQDTSLWTYNNETFFSFGNVSFLEGSIFVADTDSVFSFPDLFAIGRTTLGGVASSDFTEVDLFLSSTIFNDSIRDIWGGGDDTPEQTFTLNVSSGLIPNVSYVNSTNTSSFITGILWDSSDDSGNNEYDSTDEEDLVFVVPINSSQDGFYGNYDYEIRIPTVLKNATGTEDTLSFYFELL